MTQVRLSQKAIERCYLEEARRASSLFPSGEYTPHEPLDFLVQTPVGLLGIEITELCIQALRHGGERLGFVVPKAKALYSRRPGAKAVDVSLVFSHEAEDMSVEELASSLSDFVFEHRDSNDNFSWSGLGSLPNGYCHIGVFEPSEPSDNWRYFRAFDTTRAAKELLESCIAAKNRHLPEYRKVASAVWLLIVNDLFLGPGEVHVPVDEIVGSTFRSSFDKVLLFERKPGGTGEVTELRVA